jgi:lipoteichoic acid synthase
VYFAASGSNGLRVSGFLKALLSRRDWVYSLGLLVPFVVYNLALKAHDLAASQAGDSGLARVLDLMQADIFFNFGYALFWIGLLAAVRGGPLRWAVIVLFHAVSMLVLVVTTSAHLYFQQTGATLDYGTVAGWLPRFDEIEPILAHEVPLSTRVLLAVALVYAALVPPFLASSVERVARRRGWPEETWTGRTGASFSGSLGLFLLAIGFVSLSPLVGSGLTSAGSPLAEDRFVNVVLTGVGEAPPEKAWTETTTEETGADESTSEETTIGEDISDVAHPASNVSLVQTPETEKRNVVLIHLESTRARSVTPYNEELKTTPFLDELAKSSLLAEHARVVVPRSSKGSTAINCGVEPALFPGPEFEPGGIPSPCLAGLLKEQDYRTVFFQSVSNAANSYWDDDLARNFGYEDFYSPESMNTEGFQVTNSFGYEDDIMLGPSEGWLSANGYDKPFLAQYFTGTGHYGYDCVPNRYGYEHFSEDPQLDRYHNCLRMLDHFVKNLFDQYKRLGLYDNTIFVMYGDHGEGFFEHGRYMHGDNPYEEGLSIPLIIHDPQRFQNGERVKGLSSQIDILPTVVEMLGYKVENGKYPGYSLLHSLPEDRVLMSSCVYPYRCMASLKGTEKYIYHYGDQPEEFFDLSEDPLEQRNLAGERDKAELDERRKELLAWASRVDAGYSSFPVPSS